jgi:hypothetical protein
MGTFSFVSTVMKLNDSQTMGSITLKIIQIFSVVYLIKSGQKQTDRRGQVANTPASYAGESVLKSRPEDQTS